jgi:ABC-type lipoprotein release transport system permease subunit
MLPTTLYGWRCLTGTVLGVILAVLIAYDIVARIKGGNDATISVCTINWAEHWRVIAFVTGFVMGHIFWPCR